MTYDFKERSLTCIGEVEDGFNDFLYFSKTIEYKDELYIVSVNDDTQFGVSVKVGKLMYQKATRHDEILIFKKRIYWTIPYEQIIFLEYLLFIKDDTLYIYFFNGGFLFSLDLQDETAEQQLQELQKQHQHQLQQQQFHERHYGSKYMYYIQDPYIYLINDTSLHEIDCTDIKNMKIKTDEPFCHGYDPRNDYDVVQQQIAFRNERIYFFNSKNFYQVDIKTKALEKFLLAHIIPFDHKIKRFYITTSKNEIRAFGYDTVSKKD